MTRPWLLKNQDDSRRPYITNNSRSLRPNKALELTLQRRATFGLLGNDSYKGMSHCVSIGSAAQLMRERELMCPLM
jgi:hypothetical protein